MSAPDQPNSPRHAALMAQWQDGQRWETLIEGCTQWVPVASNGYARPVWDSRQEYRQMADAPSGFGPFTDAQRKVMVPEDKSQPVFWCGNCGARNQIHVGDAAMCDERVRTDGVQACDQVQMPDKARAGIEVLHQVVESLLTTSRYVDEEGEATQSLADLASCIANPPFKLKDAPGVAGGVSPTAPATGDVVGWKGTFNDQSKERR